MLANADSLGGAFHFFNLPAELRIEIYGYLLDDPLEVYPGRKYRENCDQLVIGQYPELDLSIYLSGAPTSSLLLVSRQMEIEYTHEMLRHKSTLFVQDRSGLCHMFGSILHGVNAKVQDVISEKVQELDYQGMIHCNSCPLRDSAYEAAVDVLEICDWIRDIVPILLRLKKVTIRLGLWWNSSSTTMWPTTPHTSRLQEALQEMVKIPYMRLVEVYRCSGDWDINRYESKGDRLCVSWTEDDGWRSAKACAGTERLRLMTTAGFQE